MLTEQDLRELIAYRPAHPVLSVYLNVDPSADSAEAHKLRLRQMLKGLEAEAPDDTEAVERFVEHEYGWTGRSLAVFSCRQDDFLRSFVFPLAIRSRARRLDRPYVKPLADLLDNYGDYGVALVDKQGARLFHFHLGELDEQEGTLGESVRHTKHGGGSQAPGRRGGTAGQTRYAEEVADRNLKEAARFAARFFQDNRVRRVLIAGTEETVAQFTALLPKKWQSLVMGTFPMDRTAGHAQVLERALALAEDAERKKEGRLVEAIITAAAKGREGVVSLDDTLSAVHAGRVQTLIFREGFRAPGYRCTGCGYLTAQRLKGCPFCGGHFDKIEDAVELAVRRVMADGGEVEVVHDNPELETAGSIGGLLRY
jgi:peptide subunit release factor 1 (eRF1)